MNNLEPFRRRKCSRCKSTSCWHRSRFVASGRHYARHGSQKSRATK